MSSEQLIHLLLVIVIASCLIVANVVCIRFHKRIDAIEKKLGK